MKHWTFATVMFLVVACGSSSGPSNPDAGGPSDGGSNPTTDAGGQPSDAGGKPSDAGASNDAPSTNGKPIIFTIVLENHDYAEIVGSSNAPYINSLIADYGLATNYKDTGHPSLPNYLHMISGDNQYPGIVDVGPKQVPWFPSKADNLGHQMTTAGIPWRSYQEDMGTACNLSNSGNYATKHDPFLYFDDIQNGPSGLCATTNVDYAASFAADLASNAYRYMWITPNLLDDGHNPTNDPVAGLKQSDTWCSTEIPKIIASAGFQAGGVLFLTWDEAEGRTGDPDRIPMIIVSPRIKSKGMTSNVAYTHSSYLATVEDLLGLARLSTVTSEANMLEFLQ